MEAQVSPLTTRSMRVISHIMSDIAVTESTEPQYARDGRFVKGGLAGPGRPKGARSKLTTLFLEDLRDVWERKGKKVLDRLADDDPAALARLVGMLLPKDVNLSLEVQNYVVRAPSVAATSAEWQAIAAKPEQSSTAEIIDLKPVDVSPVLPIGD
jgi:hypothetical protein